MIPTTVDIKGNGGGNYLKVYDTSRPDMSEVTDFAVQKSRLPLDEIRVLLDGQRVYPDNLWPLPHHLQGASISVLPAQDQMWNERYEDYQDVAYQEEADEILP